MTVPKGSGQAWWSTLTPRQKEEAVAELLDKGLTGFQIATSLEIKSRNSISTIRLRIKAHRTANNISMATWHTNHGGKRPGAGCKSGNRHRMGGISKSRIENERLRNQGHEPEIDPEMNVEPDRTNYRRHGKSTHLTAKERRERNLTHLDPDLLLGGGAFDGKVDGEQIPADIAMTFAKAYEDLANGKIPRAE